MIIPTKLRINGFDWQVVPSREVSVEGSCYGSTHFRTNTIYLDPTATQQQKEATLIHELFHVIWEDAGMNNRYKNEKNLEEEVISAVSQLFYAVLKENNLLSNG